MNNEVTGVFDNGVERIVDPHRYIKTTDVSSCCRGQSYHDVYYSHMSDEELRTEAKFTGPGQYADYSRAMLLALLTNRNKGGFVRVIDSEGWPQ